MSGNELQTTTGAPAQRQPSDATRARRDAKKRLAPFVAQLSAWHPQAARLLLEIDRALGAGRRPDDQLVEALTALRDAVVTAQSSFLDITTGLVSSRVEDLEKSFSRLIADLRNAEQRLESSTTR